MFKRGIVVAKLQRCGIIARVEQGVVEFGTIGFGESNAVVSQDNVGAVTNALGTCCCIVKRGCKRTLNLSRSTIKPTK